MISALKNVQQYVKRKGLRGTLNSVFRHYVYRHEQLLWLERDLVTPMPPHQLKATPPLRLVPITVDNVQAFGKYFGDRVETMRELAAEGHIGQMWLDEQGAACAFVWASPGDYHDSHHHHCWFRVKPGQYFQFGAESARPYWGTRITVDAQWALWEVMAAKGYHTVVDICESNNIPALRMHIRLGYKEQGRIMHIHHLFGRWKLFGESRYSDSRLEPLRKAPRRNAAAATVN